MIEKMLRMIGDRYPLRERDTGEYHQIQVNGISFNVRAFDAGGLGNAAVMTGGIPGIMNMDTLIVNPFERDMPLLSYDRIKQGGKDILLFELYETGLGFRPESKGLNGIKEAYADLQDHPTAPGWYDSILWPESIMKAVPGEMTPRMDSLAEEYAAEYLRLTSEAPVCDRDEKRKAAAAYTEGLLEHGGLSTDMFMRAKGREFTEKLFREYLFGTR